MATLKLLGVPKLLLSLSGEEVKRLSFDFTANANEVSSIDSSMVSSVLVTVAWLKLLIKFLVEDAVLMGVFKILLIGGNGLVDASLVELKFGFDNLTKSDSIKGNLEPEVIGLLWETL